MKKEYVLLGIAGVVIGYLLLKEKKKLDYYKPGDKSNDIAGFQDVVTSISGVKFPNRGAYDSETLKAVQYFLKDTPALYNEKEGYVCKAFAQTLSVMTIRSKNQ